MLLIPTSERVRTIQCCYVVTRKLEAEQTTFGTPCFLYSSTYFMVTIVEICDLATLPLNIALYYLVAFHKTTEIPSSYIDLLVYLNLKHKLENLKWVDK
nr:ORF1 [Enterovirus F]